MENEQVEVKSDELVENKDNTSESGPSSVADTEKDSSGQEVGSGDGGESATTVTTQRSESVSSDSFKTPAGVGIAGKDKDKINILLKPVGDAPILKNKLWAVPSDRLVSQITEFVKKYLKLEKNQNLFFFVNQLFAPAPDQSLRDLYECFGSDNKLVLHYSTTIAWG